MFKRKLQDHRLTDRLVKALPWALPALLATAFGLGYWHAFYKATFHGLYINDAQDYASIARNIALGRGVISQYLTPLGLAHLGVPQPDLWRAPLWPALLALFQTVFGFKDEASVLAGGACFGAGAGLVFLVGRRWFNLPVALAAASLYVFSSQLLIFTTSGLTESLAALLMLAWFYLLTGPRPDAWWQPLLAGAAGGLFYLARYNAGLFFLPALVYIWWRFRPALESRRDDAGFKAPLDFNLRCKRDVSAAPAPAPVYGRPGRPGRPVGARRGGGQATAGRMPIRPAALFLLGILLVTGPWLARNFVLTGSPFFTLQKYEPAMFTATYPEYSLYMLPVKIDVAGFIRDHPAEMAAKLAENWAAYRHDFFLPEFTGVAQPVLVAFLLSLTLPLGLWWPAQRGVRPLLVACYLLQLAVLLPLHYIGRLFIIFAPFFMLYGAACLWALGRLAAAGAMWAWSATTNLRRARRGGRGAGRPLSAVALLALAIFAVTGVQANYPDFNPPSEGPHPLSMWGEQHLRDVQDSLTGNQVVVSDIGHFFAWYGDRYACKLPLTPQLLPQLGALAPVRAIFLSHWITWDLPEADPAWLAIYRARPAEVEGFTLARVYEDGSLLYLRE